MSSFARLREDSNRIGIDFLLIELDTASTFLDVARTTSSPETRARNYANACEAYETAVRLHAKVAMEHAQKIDFDTKFSALRKRLQDLGFKV